MLESAGRPDVIAGSDPSAAAGLTQIVASTATSLLGMHVDLTASGRLGGEIATARHTGRQLASRASSAIESVSTSASIRRWRWRRQSGT